LPGREPRPQLPAPVAAVVAAPAAAVEAAAGEHVVQRVGNALGDAAWQVFASLKNGQPMPVRQLAQMMRKRGLIETDPEQVWPHLKAALLGDERSYRGLGLRPRIVYRGRDLFAPGPVAMSSTATAEAGVATALSSLAVATHRALKERIAAAGHAGFERLVHAYLVSMGYEDIEWIKRISGISYATALPPDGSSAILVSARSGDAPVDRRGVGELRVGVEAKNLLAGLLFAARELSPEAERELERPGRSIAVICGDALVSSLLQSGVGVVTVAAPLRYVDDQMLDELLAG
ncbi:MAG: restriction endonuclease, partial [Deltaproteobacteria bacterium]|nr:restriction endonuclease [Deltaproteobacteria bacterium]